jgi:hypothetical protein
MGITLLAAIGEGLAAGLIAGMLFQWVASWIPRVDLWQPAANLVRSLVAIREDDDFFARYRELLKLLGRYLVRQAIIASLPIAVVTCAFAFLPQLEKQSWGVARHFHREVAARAPVGTTTGLRTWTAQLQTVQVTSLVSVCVGSGIGMTLLRKRP